jgi:hypothetical protein
MVEDGERDMVVAAPCTPPEDRTAALARTGLALSPGVRFAGMRFLIARATAVEAPDEPLVLLDTPVFEGPLRRGLWHQQRPRALALDRLAGDVPIARRPSDRFPAQRRKLQRSIAMHAQRSLPADGVMATTPGSREREKNQRSFFA